MTTIRQLLAEKNRELLSIGPNDTVFNAIETMSKNNIGALVVLDGDRLVGIISERDYARNVILKGRSSQKTVVNEIMSTRVICARPEQTVEECMAVMTEKTVRHLPVLEKKQVIGMISIGDLVKSIISGQKFLIEQLEHYISS